eukprot:jgi/Chlat1/2443/Chrsp17S02685
MPLETIIQALFSAITSIITRVGEVQACRQECNKLASSVELLRSILSELRNLLISNTDATANVLRKLQACLSEADNCVIECATSSRLLLYKNAVRIHGRIVAAVEDIHTNVALLPAATMANSMMFQRFILESVQEIQVNEQGLRDLQDSAKQIQDQCCEVLSLVRSQHGETSSDLSNIKQQVELLLSLQDSEGLAQELQCLRDEKQRLQQVLQTHEARRDSVQADKLQMEHEYIERIIQALAMAPDPAASTTGAGGRSDDPDTGRGRREASSPPVVPEEYLCPISKDIMTDPVIVAGSGFTCERSAVQAWFHERAPGHLTCPVTGIHVCGRLVPNDSARVGIHRWLREHGMDPEDEGRPWANVASPAGASPPAPSPPINRANSEEEGTLKAVLQEEAQEWFNNLPEDTQVKLRSEFQQAAHNGQLTRTELQPLICRAVTNRSFTNAQLDTAVDELSADNGGAMDFQAYCTLSYMLSRQGTITCDNCRKWILCGIIVCKTCLLRDDATNSFDLCMRCFRVGAICVTCHSRDGLVERASIVNIEAYLSRRAAHNLHEPSSALEEVANLKNAALPATGGEPSQRLASLLELISTGSKQEDTNEVRTAAEVAARSLIGNSAMCTASMLDQHTSRRQLVALLVSLLGAYDAEEGDDLYVVTRIHLALLVIADLAKKAHAQSGDTGRKRVLLATTDGLLDNLAIMLGSPLPPKVKDCSAEIVFRLCDGWFGKEECSPLMVANDGLFQGLLHWWYKRRVIAQLNPQDVQLNAAKKALKAILNGAGRKAFNQYDVGRLFLLDLRS